MPLLFLVNCDSMLCRDCFVPALCLYVHIVDIKPRSYFSELYKHVSVGRVNQPHKSCISILSSDTRHDEDEGHNKKVFFFLLFCLNFLSIGTSLTTLILVTV